jgi:mono/diheme cytochrome c family protein/glucose/arabinose dehydrogenase
MTARDRQHSRPPYLVLAFAIAAASFAVVAQTPGPPGQAPAQVQQTSPPPQPPGGRGRGLGGGRKDDPINADVDWTRQPPLQPKTPAEQLKQFILQPGYRLELVLADPIIQEPTAIAFDGNGRMFVVEDRSYMLDLDMTGQLDPISRISRHVDTDNDGVYDKHTVFVDNLVFPRFVTPFGPGVILTKESNADEVWKYTDTDGDGDADRKELFDTGYGRLGNVEGQEAFLTWTLDNWMYSTYNAFRARWTPHGVIKEQTGSNGGEWGVTQDNDGKIWFESGAPGVPSGFQFPIVYGNFNVPDQFEPDFRIPWGAPIRIADMQGGMAATRMPDGSLKSVTASAGNDVFRGHRLPKELVGELFSGEPVARIVRQIHPENREGLTILHNAYPGNEFIKSLDPYFRPVDITTAPDGTLYITDMYHGIIQVGNFTRPGSYLRAKIQQYDLDKVVHKGRIWRLVYDGVKPDRSDRLRRDRTVPRMNNETAAQLVRHLSHPNGWWRDTAQQLLVLKQNKSVVPALRRIVKTSPDLLARFHAMWTLEGLGALEPALVRQQMEDPEPRMRIQAIRASETLYKAGDRSFANDYKALANDPSVDVVIQALLTLNRWKVPDAATIIEATMRRNQARGVQVVASTILNPPAGRGGGRGVPLTPEEQRVLDRGAAIYNELCFACHAPDGMGTPKPELSTTMAPPLAGSPRVNGHRDYIIKAVLHGLTGPVDDKTYTDVMMPMGVNNDEWVAAVSSFVRRSFGNTGGFVTPADVARVRAATAGRTSMWTVPELMASLPALLFTDRWKATASHNGEAANGGLSLTAWNSGVPQEAGMWFQIELPEPEMVAEMQFQSPPAGGLGAAVSPGGSPVSTPAGPGFPRRFQLGVSLDGTSWTTVAEGAATASNTTVAFQPVRAKFVRITLTASVDNGPPWSVQALRLFGVPQSGGAARDR